MNLKHFKNNAEENYITTPISVLRYISELEKIQKEMEKTLNKYHRRLNGNK